MLAALSTYFIYFGSFGSLFWNPGNPLFCLWQITSDTQRQKRRSRMQHTLGLLWTLFVDFLSLLTFESLVDLLILYVIYRLGHWLCKSFFNFSNPAPHCSLSCWLFTPLRLSLLRTSCTFCNPKLIFPTPLTLTSDIAYRQPTRERKRGTMSLLLNFVIIVHLAPTSCLGVVIKAIRIGTAPPPKWNISNLSLFRLTLNTAFLIFFRARPYPALILQPTQHLGKSNATQKKR